MALAGSRFLDGCTRRWRLGAARRRRERRLRAFHRHEAMSVRLALATALHHSAQRVEVPREVEEHATHVGLRAHMTPLPGTQPAALREPGLQLVVEHASRPCSSGVPPLPALGGDCSLDDVAVQFLVAQTLLERERLGVEGGGGGGGGVEGSSGQQGASADGGGAEFRAFPGSHFSALARGSRCCLVVRGQDYFDEEGKEEEEEVEEEAEDEEGSLAPVWISAPLSSLMPLTIRFFLVSTAPCIWQSLVLFGSVLA